MKIKPSLGVNVDYAGVVVGVAIWQTKQALLPQTPSDVSVPIAQHRKVTVRSHVKLNLLLPPRRPVVPMVLRSQ